MSADCVSVFDWLLGRWTFVRKVPGYATATGEAWVRSEGEDRARYEETAQVSLVQGGTLRGKQCYLYRRLPRPANGFEVFFCEGGELFERLEFEERGDGWLEARARYLCGADEYVSEFGLDGHERLEVRHTIRGPKKDYRVETVFSRSPSTRLRAR